MWFSKVSRTCLFFASYAIYRGRQMQVLLVKPNKPLPCYIAKLLTLMLTAGSGGEGRKWTLVQTECENTLRKTQRHLSGLNQGRSYIIIMNRPATGRDGGGMSFAMETGNIWLDNSVIVTKMVCGQLDRQDEVLKALPSSIGVGVGCLWKTPFMWEL